MTACTRQCSGVARLNDQRGVALAAAVFALAIIGALVASSFFAGRLEQRSGQSTVFAAQAREAAEAGLSEAMSGLEVKTLVSLPASGTSVDLGTIFFGDGVTARSRVTRLTSRVFLIRAEGARQDAHGATLATRSLGLLVQLAGPSPAGGESGSSESVTRLAERGWVHLY